MGFRSPLDIGVGNSGFLKGFDRRNDENARCRTCGRDKRLNARRTELPTTDIKQRCSECRAPLIWAKTNSSGEREEHEWLIQDKKEVIRRGNKGRGFRVEFD